MQTDTDVAPRLRRDAQRNRQLLIDAATEVLREQGMDASLDEIARRAGVGNATLYRRFPTREDLYEAVFANMGGMVGEAAMRAHLIDDPWTAFATYIEEITQFCAADRGLSDLMMAGMAKSPALNAVRLESERVLQDLLDRAQRQGAIRPDIYLEDGGVFEIADVRLDVIHTPGHTPGSICLYSEQLGVLFTGDILHKGKPGQVGDVYPELRQQLNSIGSLQRQMLPGV